MKKIVLLLVCAWVSLAIGAAGDEEEQKALFNLPPEIQAIIARYTLSDDIKKDLFDRPLLKRILLPAGSEKHVIAYVGNRIAYAHGDPFCSAAFNKAGTHIVSAGRDKTVRIWDTHTNQESHILRGHENWVNSAVFNHDGTLIASASNDKTIRIWNAHTGKQLHEFRDHGQWVVNSAIFNNQGTHIISASNDGAVRIWDVETGKAVRIFSVPSLNGDSALGATDNKQGTQVVAGYTDGTVRLWDMKTGSTVHTFHGHERLPWHIGLGPGHVFSVAFNDSGTKVLSAGIDRTIRLWDAQEGTLLLTLCGHKRWVKSVKFNPQETLIVSASNDGTVRIWDATTGQELYTLRSHESWVSSAEFDTTGNHIVSASFDGTIRIWDARTLPYERYHFSLEQAIWISNAYHEIMHEDKQPKKSRLSEGGVDPFDSSFNFYCFVLSQQIQDDTTDISQDKRDQIIQKLTVEHSIKQQYPEILERLTALRLDKEHRLEDKDIDHLW